MYNNFYIRFNYKNILPFNLKKKKLRIHTNIIGSKTTSLHGFFVGSGIKFWYYYFGVTGLKRDGTILIKQFLNKKLSVFFISNFNMIEGKWAFPKIYEQYYEKNLFFKRNKFNFIKYNLMFCLDKKNYYDLHYFLYLFTNKYSNSLFKLNYFFDLKNLKYIYFNNVNYNNFFKYLIYNLKKEKDTIICNNLNNNFKFKFFWNLKFIKKKFQKSIRFKKINLQVKKIKFLKFLIVKKILKIIQFIKLFKSIRKMNKKNILFLFYIFFVYFKIIKLKKFNLFKKKLFFLKNISLFNKNKLNYIIIFNNFIYRIIKYKIIKNKIIFNNSIFYYQLINELYWKYSTYIRLKRLKKFNIVNLFLLKQNNFLIKNYYYFNKNNLLLLKQKNLMKFFWKKKILKINWEELQIR